MPLRMIDLVSKDVYDGAISYICNECTQEGSSIDRIKHFSDCRNGIILNMIRGIKAAREKLTLTGEAFDVNDILEVTLEETIKE